MYTCRHTWHSTCMHTHSITTTIATAMHSQLVHNLIIIIYSPGEPGGKTSMQLEGLASPNLHTCLTHIALTAVYRSQHCIEYTANPSTMAALKPGQVGSCWIMSAWGSGYTYILFLMIIAQPSGDLTSTLYISQALST